MHSVMMMMMLMRERESGKYWTGAPVGLFEIQVRTFVYMLT